MTQWNAAQYLKFENERTQPAIDLARRLPCDAPAKVLDVGCGPGNSSRVLATRFPHAAVLGIDSSPAMLLEQTLEELEEDYGVEILSAQNGEEGLALIRSNKPDVVFLDIMMPKLNGYEVCQRVKEDPDITDIGIVLLTAKGQEVDRRQGLELGASRYMRWASSSPASFSRTCSSKRRR